MSADATFRQAVALHRQNRLAEAEAGYTAVLKELPAHFEALNLLGGLRAMRGDAAGAYELFDRAVRINPQAPATLSNRGFALRSLGRRAEALESIERALALRPDYPIALNNRGLVLHDLGRIEDAVASYGQALELMPDYAEARANRKLTVEALLAKYEGMLTSQPDYPEALLNRGLVLQDLNRFAEALASFDRAIAARPGFAEAHLNHGLALQALERHDEALASYVHATGLKPDFAQAHFLAGQCALLLGRMERGWKDYESRPRGEHARIFKQPPWLGDGPVAGKTFFIHAEQGVGDTVQMARYVKPLAAQGARVILEVQPPLRPLMENLPDCTVIAMGEPAPAFDLHCPVMSLPLAFGTTLDTIPSPGPYLSAPPARVTTWNQRLGPRRRYRVGIAWSGRPSHANDANRSIPLEALAPLLALPADFFCLQKDIRGADQRAAGGFSNLRILTEEISDFADVAAIIGAMDLVISVDTAAAHVAGAIGKTVWILLPWVPDWRWLLKQSDSPWYPSARLFRQARPDSWPAVINDVTAALRPLLS